MRAGWIANLGYFCTLTEMPSNCTHCTVQNLIIFLIFCRTPTEKAERSPLKLLQSPICNGPTITINAPVHHRPNHAVNEADLSSSCRELSQTTEEERIHAESTGEENDVEMRKESGRGEAKDEEDTEQKFYKIARELLQTERAYVARLHLLDQVSVVTSL